MARYASHLAHHADADTAIDVAADHIAHDLGGAVPSLVVVTASDAFRDDAEALHAAVARRFPDAAIAGAVIPGGVIGVGEETEAQPAVSILAAALPDGAARVVELDDADDLPPETSLAVVLADPFTLDADRLAARADALGCRLAGGFTGGQRPGAARLLATDGVRADGAVLVALDLADADVLVSQGARPIGPDLVVTAAEGNVVLELAGKAAAEQVHAVLGALSPDDLALARRGLMAGIVVDENRPEYEVGDFLIRGLLGVESETGGLAIAAEPRVGQTLRFHVRDAAGADADLRRVLAGAEGRAGAALLFACNGRGRHMFEAPHHDAAVIGGGFVGFMLGTTANAMANLNAITKRHGPAPRAYLVVPLVGACGTDFVNAAVITALLAMFRG